MRTTLLAVALALCAGIVLCAGAALGAPDSLEGLAPGTVLTRDKPLEGWTARSGKPVVSDAVAHTGKVALRLEAAAAAQAVDLTPGLWEVTVWARGQGGLELLAQGPASGSRRFTLFDEWAQYSLLFEATAAGTARVVLVGAELAVVDDLEVTPASAEQQAAWEKAKAQYAALGWLPESPQKPAPTPGNLAPTGLQTVSPADLEQGRIREKVVYYDADYETSWVDEPDQVARYYTDRGFTALGAAALGKWMQEKTAAATAPGTVVVAVMGVVPSSLVEWASLPANLEGDPHVADCTLVRYLRAGGRVVWLANTPMYQWQDATGPIKTIDGRYNVLGIGTDRKYFYGGSGPTEISPAGKQWGVQGNWGSVRPAPLDQVTLSFVTDAAHNLACVWLKNFNPAYPLSGFISLPNYTKPTEVGLLADAYRCALYSGEAVTVPEVAPVAVKLPALEVKVLPYSDDRLPRRAYLRRETPRVRVQVINRGGAAVQAAGTLYLQFGEKRTTVGKFTVTAAAGAEGTMGMSLPLENYRVAQYRLVGIGAVGGQAFTAEAPLWVCPEPDTDILFFALWGDPPAIPYRRDKFFESLTSLGATGNLVNGLSPEGMDAALWHAMPTVARLHGTESPYYNFSAPVEELYRLNASGEPFPNPWEGGRRTLQGIANAEWQRAGAEAMGQWVADFAQYPAFHPVICTSDDLSARSGLDYNPANLRRFKELTGLEAPKPPETLKEDNPGIAAPKGIVPDDDPWLLWSRFLSLDVLGGYNRQLTEAVVQATQGRGRIGPIPGGMQIPLVQMWSSQWPPYNFGPQGYNLIFSYNYNNYWVPSLSQVWWYELGRMGNREMDEWLMPDSMHPRRSYHLSNWYLFMAAGLDGLAYFTYDGATPAFIEAAKRVGPLCRDYGKLLRRLQPAPRNVGLLMPFEEGVHRLTYHIDLNYTFCDLAMAHTEVEPVWPEELPSRGRQYRVLLLADVDWLTASNLRRLQDYLAQGGTVVCDSATEVEIPGAKKLDFPLIVGHRANGYGNLEQVAKVKAAVEQYAQPWAQSDDPHLLLRRYQRAGVDYLWVVNLMTKDQDLAQHPRMRPPGVDLDQVEREAGFDLKQYTGTVTLPGGNYAVYDALRGTPLTTTTKDGRVVVPVSMGVWQGCLLAIYPVKPESLKISPARVDASRLGQQTYSVALLAGNKAVAGDFPLRVTVTEPDGKVSREYSRTALTRNGSYELALYFAPNDAPGEWKLTVREMTTGLEQTVKVKVGR